MGDDNEETQVSEIQIEEDNNPTPNENDSNPAVIENNDTEATISTQAAMNKRKGVFSKHNQEGHIKVFDVEREKTMKLLDTNRSRIAITTDMWTSNNQKRGFMTITSHFIDDAWNLQSRLIRFIYVPCPHTVEVLADALLEGMFEWNLDRKLSTLTVDNCSTNDSMIAIVVDKICSSSLMLDGRLFHMRCCAHILNLVVRDGLEVIKKSIEKIRYSVAFWLGTQKREEKFLEVARQLRVPTSKMLELDCKTRWNSTYSMLKTAMIYKDVFPRLEHREPLYKEVPSESNWAKTKELVDKLAILAIYDWLSSEQEEVQAMTLHMQTKFEKYWDTIHGLMGVASILDPRNDDDDFDILCWWKSNGIKYPTLHDIARDILVILVSTVASESCFSTSGRVVSPHRSWLHLKIVEALMCARDWLWSEIRGSSPNENEVRRVTVQDEEVDNNEEEESTIEAENISLFFD
ncbi:hypothetical protein L3X38_041799 [Prunus dulcis]|uniref:BED zinc finger n=1 Tax=Prunus dulcis TaxID=3755 RepID=A0AAD4UV14_PRUDU|nr:hypothetical protein L3X38_041799 [Prunus dulcis]